MANPTITISSTTTGVSNDSTTNDTTISLTFTSSIVTTNFALEDINVSGGTLSDFSGSGTTYSATLTPSGSGQRTQATTTSKHNNERKQPMIRQNINCPDLEVDMIAKHFCYHSINPKRMLKNDILFLNNAQSFLRQNGLLKENIASGTKSLNNGFMKQWNQISKTKIELIMTTKDR